ncbi:TPA: helicase [Yersinia enterocolitica]|nr:helicase [Yersinia enterocolitica]
MQDDKTLQDKQLIRAIADLVIQDPSRATELFGNLDKIVMLYPELEGVRNLVVDLRSENYIKDLDLEINKIKDKVTRNIFLSALSYYINNQVKNQVKNHVI